MKYISRALFFMVALFAAATVYGAAPKVEIAVKQRPGNKLVKQVTTDSSGNFALGTLPPGAYTLEFRAEKSSDVRNKQFSIALDGTKASGQQSVAGNSLVGGVALQVEVGPKGKVTGQVVAGPTVAVQKKKIWIPKQLGSNMPGRWVEEGSPEHVAAKNAGSLGIKDVQRMQESASNPAGN